MLTTPLKCFQKQTVDWMLNQEIKNDGGFLFNEAGTGKTICCLDVISKTCKSKSSHKDVNCQADIYKKTLIICPAGLVSNWENEIKKHTKYTDKNILKYVGKNRLELVKTKEYNNHIIFCIASFSVVARESNDSGNFIDGSLFNNTFSRIILDEAHYIRNWNGKIFKSIINIQSQLKWVVTATPIFNKVDDMYSYFRFLQLESIDSRKEWSNLLQSKSGILSYKHLNDIVKDHSLRVYKSQVLAQELQPKTEYDVKIKLNDFEKDFYDSLWNYSMQRMKSLTSRLKNLSGLSDIESKLMKQLTTNNILVYILRLKQSCNNPWLVIGKMKRLQNVKTLHRATERLKFFNSSLYMEEECPICYDNLANAIASPCGHKCCTDCWDKIMHFGLSKCPKCRSEINSIKTIDIITVNEPECTSPDLESELKCSSKIKHLIEIVQEKRKNGEKIVVVSQWVKMLDIVREVLLKQFPNIKTVSLQGDMSMKSREKSINYFQNDNTIEICYISLMSSAEGINLTAANNLVLLDTWWNQSKMIQVSDRVHRIGQARSVNIYKLTVGGNDSIEERVNTLISKKEKLKALVMNKWCINNVESYDDNWIKVSVKLIDRQE